MLTTAIFLRHGPTQENKEERIQGHQHGTLLLPDTEHYIASIIPIMHRYTISALLSSDLERAIQTRLILGMFLQLPHLAQEALPLFRERSLGRYEGMLWSSVPAEIRNQHRHTTYNFRAWGGEDDDDVSQRVTLGLRHLAHNYPRQVVAVVTHSGWLHQLVHSTGFWSDASTVINRTAMYAVMLSENGALQQLSTIPIKAKLPADLG